MNLISITYFNGYAKALYSNGARLIISTADADMMINMAECGYIVGRKPGE